MNKKAMILGYTRAGHEVILPASRSPAPRAFNNWTRGDHADAAHILKEHSEREQNPEIESWCKRWAKSHGEMRQAASNIRGAAEISIKIRGTR